MRLTAGTGVGVDVVCVERGTVDPGVAVFTRGLTVVGFTQSSSHLFKIFVKACTFQIV